MSQWKTLIRVAEIAALGGIDYIHSLTNPMASCSQAGPATWVAPAGSERLKAQVGVGVGAAEPKARVAFLVTVGSTEVFSKVLAVGEHEPLYVGIASGDRLTIETRFILRAGSEETGNTEAVAVWGDLRVLNGGAHLELWSQLPAATGPHTRCYCSTLLGYGRDRGPSRRAERASDLRWSQGDSNP